MGSVTLTSGWVHLAATPATYVTLDAQVTAEEASRPVIVKRYAAGRLRAVTQPGIGSRIDVEARLVPRATVDTLRSWVGEIVMWRDVHGRKVYSVFPVMRITEALGFAARADIGFTLEETTWDEEV